MSDTITTQTLHLQDTVSTAADAEASVTEDVTFKEPARQHKTYDCLGTMPFPQNFLRDVFGRNNIPTAATNDLLPTVFYCFYRFGRRPGDILVMRYRDRMTLDEIGNTANISKQRVMQIIQGTLDNIRSSECRGILEFGLKSYVTNSWQSAFRPILLENTRQTRAQTIQEISNYLNSYTFTDDQDDISLNPSQTTLLTDLNLSVRTFNALHRSNCATVEDVITLGPAKVAGIRGLGKKGFREISNILINRFGENPVKWAFSNQIMYKSYGSVS